MKIQDKIYQLSISKRFINILFKEMSKAGIDAGDDVENYVILNFRDPDYSSANGGYHPVEVMINSDGTIQYITDFTYIGQELVKELDFDFNLKLFQHMGREHPISSGRGIFRIFQSNFCDYYASGAYDVVASSF
jgi:hypothetical protein